MNVIDGPNQEFALRLIDLRRRQQLTQHELATRIGADKRSISMYENGRSFPRKETLERLAQQLDVDVYWLKTGQSPEVRKYLEDQWEKFPNGNEPMRKVELLPIESWDDIGNDTYLRRKIYTEEPSCDAHSSNIALFIPVLKSAFDMYRAAALPNSFQCNSFYQKGTVVTFDQRCMSIDSIPSGSDIIFRISGKENKPGLRKLIKEPGNEPMLIALDPTTNLPVLMLDEIDILGVVIGISKPL